MKIPYRYFLIESGELLEKCLERKRRYDIGHDAASQFAESRGAVGYTIGFAGRICALLAGRGDPPDGWRAFRGSDKWTPVGGSRNKVVEAEVNALPLVPLQDSNEVSGWIGFDQIHRYTHADDGGAGWRRLPNCQHIATVGGDEAKHAIIIPAEHHGLTFPVPAGCREVTEAEWRLISAQAEVDLERRRAA